jgi:hypothetical protein
LFSSFPIVRQAKMIELSEKQIAEFFHRSYTAVDGLWFMKVEEKYGFDVALDIDDEVWKVLPKIQARLLKSMVKLTNGLDAFLECFATKLAVEGFEFEVEKHSKNGLMISISRCPWHDFLVRSGREALSGKIGARICSTEYSTWAAEFGRMQFDSKSRICEGAERCVIEFRL